MKGIREVEGEALKTMRSFIQRKAKNVNEVSWGSSDKVTLSVMELESVAKSIAVNVRSMILPKEDRQ